MAGLPEPDGKHPPARSARQSRAGSSGAASHHADGDDDAYHFAKSLFDMKVNMLHCAVLLKELLLMALVLLPQLLKALLSGQAQPCLQSWILTDTVHEERRRPFSLYQLFVKRTGLSDHMARAQLKEHACVSAARLYLI